MSDKENTSNKDNLKYNPEVTEHDKKTLLGEKNPNIRGDNGDDSLLYDREKPVDFAGKDLDIPGREIPNQHKNTSLKSEENQHHSLGSEHNENLEQADDTVGADDDLN